MLANTNNLLQMCSFDTSNKSTKGASKLRRDLINAEIANLRDLLPLPSSTRQRLSQLQLMALVCVYVRKANYFQHVFRKRELPPDGPIPHFGFSKALSGFLMMMTQNGKLLYISDNAAEYLGHSMEDLLIHGDSVYDIIEKQDHQAIQAELMRTPLVGPTSVPGLMVGGAADTRLFLCRMNVSRNARRQMRFGDQKVVLVEGHFVSYLPLCSRNEPVFLATCTPVAMPETRECVVQGSTTVFTSIHSMDMKFLHIDLVGECHLGYSKSNLQGVSWYELIHWEHLPEAQSKHRLITQSEQERSCILLLRMQEGRSGRWLWVHVVLQIKDGSDSSQQSVIVCTNQILSEKEAAVMRANSWLYQYYSLHSKMHYGLAYETHHPTARLPTTAAAAAAYYSAVMPYHHHPHPHHHHHPHHHPPDAAVPHSPYHLHPAAVGQQPLNGSHHHHHHQQQQPPPPPMMIPYGGGGGHYATLTSDLPEAATTTTSILPTRWTTPPPPQKRARSPSPERRPMLFGGRSPYSTPQSLIGETSLVPPPMAAVSTTMPPSYYGAAGPTQVLAAAAAAAAAVSYSQLVSLRGHQKTSVVLDMADEGGSSSSSSLVEQSLTPTNTEDVSAMISSSSIVAKAVSSAGPFHHHLPIASVITESSRLLSEATDDFGRGREESIRSGLLPRDVSAAAYVRYGSRFGEPWAPPSPPLDTLRRYCGRSPKPIIPPPPPPPPSSSIPSSLWSGNTDFYSPHHLMMPTPADCFPEGKMSFDCGPPPPPPIYQELSSTRYAAASPPLHQESNPILRRRPRGSEDQNDVLVGTRRQELYVTRGSSSAGSPMTRLVRPDKTPSPHIGNNNSNSDC